MKIQKETKHVYVNLIVLPVTSTIHIWLSFQRLVNSTESKSDSESIFIMLLNINFKQDSTKKLKETNYKLLDE